LILWIFFKKKKLEKRNHTQQKKTKSPSKSACFLKYFEIDERLVQGK